MYHERVKHVLQVVRIDGLQRLQLRNQVERIVACRVLLPQMANIFGLSGWPGGRWLYWILARVINWTAPTGRHRAGEIERHTPARHSPARHRLWWLAGSGRACAYQSKQSITSQARRSKSNNSWQKGT